MGKSTKPTKWFKAVKKAFRSPSKERPSPRDKQGDADEKLLTKQDFPPVSYPAPTPHPLPSFEVVTPNEVSEPQHSHGPPPALPTTPDQAVTHPARPENNFDKKPKVVEEEQKNHSRNGNIYVVEKHQDDDNDSTLSEEDEAATRIQQRFLRSPLGLKGLIRLQALVRGQLVRRQAATTLRTMEAIVRVQALFRGRRVRMSKDGRAVKSRISRIQRLSSRANADPRREEFQEMEPETNEAEHEANKRKRRTAYLLTQQLKRSTPNRSSSFIDCDPDQPHEGWAWLELWTNAKAWESRQLEAAAHESKLDSKDYIEIIPGSSRRTSDYTSVKEVDVSTLHYKVKYHDSNGIISNSNPALDGTTSKGLGPEEEEEEEEVEGFTPKKSISPNLTTPSPAASEDAAIPDGIIPPSPQASEASVKLDSGDEDPSSIAMEHLILPEAANGSITHSDSFSTSNGVHQAACPGAEVHAANGEAPVAEVGNGTIITRNGNHENGDCNKTRKEESPVASKRTTCRYMAATESAKAKFRSSSNPKTRGSTPEAPESPGLATPKQRNSLGGTGGTAGTNGMGKAAESPGKTPVAFGTRKTTALAVQNRRSPSPKTGGPKEKPRSVDAGHGGISPARRNSLDSGDDKRWRT